MKISPIKIALVLIPTGSLILGGWYVVDRVFIKKAPLFPFNLKKALSKKADSALSMAKNKLTTLMDEKKINSFGVVYDDEIKKNYIEIRSDKITPDLKMQIPNKVQGIEIRIVEGPAMVTQSIKDGK